LIFFFIVFPPFESKNTFTHYINEALHYYNNHLYQQSINTAYKALNLAYYPEERKTALKILFGSHTALFNLDSAYLVMQELLPYMTSVESLKTIETFVSLALAQSEYRKGLKALEILDRPNDTLRLLKSLCYLGIDSLKQSLKQLENVNLPAAYYIRTYIYYKQNNKLKAYKEVEGLQLSLLKIMAYYDAGYLSKTIPYEDSLKNLPGEEKIYAEAIVYFAMDSLGTASLEGKLKNFLKENPTHPLVYPVKLILSDIYVRKGYYKKAIRTLKEINISMLQDSNLIARFYRLKAESFYRLQKFSKALVIYDTLLNYFKHYTDTNFVYFRRGKINYLQGKLGMAIQDLQHVTSESKYYGWSIYYNAKVKIKLGNIDDALKILRFLESHSEDKELKFYVYKLKGELYEKKRIFNLARENYINAAQLSGDPKTRYDLFYRAEYCNYKLGKYKSAPQLNISYIKKYPESPKNPELLYELFLYYYKTGLFTASLKTLDTMINLYPDEEPTLLALKYLVEHHKDHQIEEILLTYSSKTKKFLNDVFLLLGKLKERTGNDEDALKFYSKVKGKLKEEADICIMEILYRNNKLDELLNYAEELRENVNTRSGYNALIFTIKALRDKGLEEAMWSLIEQYKLENFRFKADFLIFISDIYLEAGDTLKAIRTLEEAEKIAVNKQLRRRIEEKIKKILEGI